MDFEMNLDLSPFSKEMLLLMALSGSGTQLSLSDADLRRLSEIDWNHFYQLAHHHRVYPAVYQNLKNMRLAAVPDLVMEKLGKLAADNTFHMFSLTAEMDRVCKSFDDHRIRPLMLKGPLLSDVLYGDLSLRTCKDLDILVPIHDVEKAERLLIEAGYRPDDEEIRILNDWKWRVHHISYTHPERKVQIELHWRLNPDKGTEPGFAELWERSRVSMITGHPIRYLGEGDMFLFLAVHGARHGWFRLRWLADIDRLVRGGSDWASIVPLMRQYHCLYAGGQALALAAGLLGTPLAEELRPLVSGNHPRRLAESAIVFMKDMITLSPVPKPLTIYYRRYLFSLRSPLQKGLFVISQLYPNNRDLETLPLPKKLYLLYFPLRPFLWCWRRMRQQSST